MKKFTVMFTAILSLNIFSVSYAQFTHTFTYAGQVINDDVWHVAVGPDGTVFMSGSGIGLFAYDHSDTSFTNMRQINESGSGAGITVRSDGIVFLAKSRLVKAYTYDDTSITKLDEVSLDPAFPRNTAIGPDGIVFVASQSGGISAYLFEDSLFTFLDQVTDPNTADGIAVGPDSIVYVAARDDGFYAFSFYDDSTFTMLDHINVIQANNVGVNPNGVIFFANGNIGGLLAYTFNGASFDSVTNWKDPQGALDVDFDSDGTIFLANSLDGLRALTFDGTTLTNTAHVNVGANTRDVAVGPDGIIYTADDNVALSAWLYEQVTAIGFQEPLLARDFQLSQNYPNPFNPSTNIEYSIPQESVVELKVYDVLGNEIATLVNEEQSAGVYRTDFNSTGLTSGIYFYKLQTESFTQTKKMILLR